MSPETHNLILEELRRRIGMYLRTCREKAGLSLEVAATKARLEFQTEDLEKIEAGLRSVRLTELTRLTHLYKIDLVEFTVLLPQIATAVRSEIGQPQ